MKDIIKILVVDDNRIIRHLLKLTFNELHFKVMEADSSKNALPIIEAENPDFIFLDIMMPGELDGIGLCKMIKTELVFCKGKVVLLTAKSQQLDFELGFEAGADFYITKPFSPKELLNLVKAS